MVIPLTHHKKQRSIAIRLKIQTKSSHKIHRSELLRLDFVNLNSWIAIAELKVVGGYPFVYRIFSRCAKGMVIKRNALAENSVSALFVRS